jgi:hypothetical protein
LEIKLSEAASNTIRSKFIESDEFGKLNKNQKFYLRGLKFEDDDTTKTLDDEIKRSKLELSKNDPLYKEKLEALYKLAIWNGKNREIYNKSIK